MRADQRAEILRRLEECRVALAATTASFQGADESVTRSTHPPTKQEVDQFIDSLQKDAQTVRSFDQMVDEFEWLARPAARTIRGEGVSEVTGQDGSVDVLRGTETPLEGIRSAIRNVATILGALEHGERVGSHECPERRHLVTALAVQCDHALQQIAVLRERIDEAAMPRQGRYRRRRGDR